MGEFFNRYFSQIYGIILETCFGRRNFNDKYCKRATGCWRVAAMMWSEKACVITMCGITETLTSAVFLGLYDFGYKKVGVTIDVTKLFF